MNDELIKQFKTAHQSILVTIDQINPMTRSYRQAKPFIRDLQTKLLAHFERQNDSLFKPLEEFHAEHRPSAKMIEFLRYDLKDIKIKLLVFFDRHSGEINDIYNRSFPKDFTEFSQAVIGRIKVEEDFLLPLLKLAKELKKKNGGK